VRRYLFPKRSTKKRREAKKRARTAKKSDDLTHSIFLFILSLTGGYNFHSLCYHVVNVPAPAVILPRVVGGWGVGVNVNV
jgi:hypothetical protein